MLRVLLALWIAAVVALAGANAVRAAQMMVPDINSWITIGGADYHFSVVKDLRGPVRGDLGLEIRPVAGETVCPNGSIMGLVEIDAGMSPMQQAKAMIHETVHIAQTCDSRELPLDERISEDIADLLNSAEGPFIEKELGR